MSLIWDYDLNKNKMFYPIIGEDQYCFKVFPVHKDPRTERMLQDPNLNKRLRTMLEKKVVYKTFPKNETYLKRVIGQIDDNAYETTVKELEDQFLIETVDGATIRRLNNLIKE